MTPAEAEEVAAIEAERKAFEEKQQAFFEMNSHWLPRGNGLPPPSVLEKYDAKNAAWKTAKAKVERITGEIVSGKRR